MTGIAVGMSVSNTLLIDQSGATVVSRGGRLYVRHQGTSSEVDLAVRVIMGSGFGFVITADALEVCVRRHIEMIVTNAAQSFVAIYAPYAPCQSRRTDLTIRMRQFAAIANRAVKLQIAKNVVRRKIVAERHDKDMRSSFLADVVACESVTAIRHVEARSAQEWWRGWQDFEIHFEKRFKAPKQWLTFQTRYIGRRQGKVGELPRQFTARFAETPLQALHNFVAIVVARMTRVIAARGLDPCFGFLHDGRKPGRFSLAWDGIEVFRPTLATTVFEYAAKKVFGQADFVSQAGVVRLSPWIARETAITACKAAPLPMLVGEIRKIEKLISETGK